MDKNFNQPAEVQKLDLAGIVLLFCLINILSDFFYSPSLVLFLIDPYFHCREFEDGTSLDGSIENIERGSLASFGSGNTTDSDNLRIPEKVSAEKQFKALI